MDFFQGMAWTMLGTIAFLTICDVRSSSMPLCNHKEEEENPVGQTPPDRERDDMLLAQTPRRISTVRQRVLVAGGAGFVGSHLVDRLMKDGCSVIVIDNLHTGRKKNIAQWKGHPRFTFLLHDVTVPLYLEVDYIYNLACPASPPHYQDDRIKTIKTSVLGTLNLLEMAHRVGARILLTSTSEVYGDPHVHPQHEEYWGNVNPVGPRSCYDEGKRIGETLMKAYESQCHVDVRIARIFNTYGPRMHPNDGRVVSNFIVQALQDKPITIYGDGRQTRSFQYIDDLVEGLVRLMHSDYKNPVNVGNPEECSMNELADVIKKKTLSKSPIVHLPSTLDDPMRRRPDISLAEKVLGWTPSVSTEEGLAYTIPYFRREIDEYGGDIVPTGQTLLRDRSFP